MTHWRRQINMSTFEVPVTTGAEAFQVFRSKTITVEPCKPVYLYADRMSAYVSDWGGANPTNVGTTTRITCVDVNDPKNRIDPHYGVNIVKTERLNPAVRTMLTKPGTYYCELKARAYSTAAVPGMTVTYEGEVRFNHGVVGCESHTWGGEPEAGLDPQQGTLRLRSPKIFNVVPGQVATLAVDYQVTNCNSGDATRVPSVCTGGTSSAPGNKFRVYGAIQPMFNGAKVGSEIRHNVDMYVSNAKHHQTFLSTPTYVVQEGVNQLNAHVGIYMFDGDRGWLHGPYHYSRATMIL